MIDVSVRRAVSAVVTVVALLVVAAFVVQAMPGIIGADAGYVVLSGSMAPAISAGDVVIVNDVDAEEIEAGDIITYVRSAESTPITHRVVEVVDSETGPQFRTQGDANEDPDSQLVAAENVIGQVWFTIPYIGHVVLFANTTRGFLVLVGLPIIALILSELYTFTRRDAPENAATEETDSAASEHSLTDGGGTATAAEIGDVTTADVTAEPTSDEAVALTTRDIQLSSLGFGALAVYSGYVAYLDPTPLHVAVLAGSAMVLVFIGTMFLTGDGEVPDRPAERGDADDE